MLVMQCDGCNGILTHEEYQRLNLMLVINQMSNVCFCSWGCLIRYAYGQTPPQESFDLEKWLNAR